MALEWDASARSRSLTAAACDSGIREWVAHPATITATLMKYSSWRIVQLSVARGRGPGYLITMSPVDPLGRSPTSPPRVDPVRSLREISLWILLQGDTSRSGSWIARPTPRRGRRESACAGRFPGHGP